MNKPGTVLSSPNPTLLEDLLGRAEAMLPELVERREEIEAAGQLPQDLAEKLAAQGFYRLASPEGAGGLNIGTRGMCEVVELLAKGNGSAAWCAFICSTSHLLVGAATEELRRDLMADPNVIVSGVFADSGTARFEARDGEPGYVINGHWRFGSSSRNAAWITGALHEVDEAGETIASDPPIIRVFLTPDDVELLDNWNVSGLKGSGSSDYVARDAWVPANRMVRAFEASPLADEPVYRFPRLGGIATPAGAIAIGMARACINEILEVAKAKTPTGSRRSLAMRPILHRDIAILDTKLAAARCYFYQCIDEIWAHVQHAEATLEQRRMLRCANVHALDVAVEVIDRMYRLAGGTSIYAESCLQQHFRDVHVASQHMMMSENVMELAGRVMIGLDDSAPGL